MFHRKNVTAFEEIKVHVRFKLFAMGLRWCSSTSMETISSLPPAEIARNARIG